MPPPATFGPISSTRNRCLHRDDGRRSHSRNRIDLHLSTSTQFARTSQRRRVVQIGREVVEQFRRLPGRRFECQNPGSSARAPVRVPGHRFEYQGVIRVCTRNPGVRVHTRMRLTGRPRSGLAVLPGRVAAGLGVAGDGHSVPAVDRDGREHERRVGVVVVVHARFGLHVDWHVTERDQRDRLLLAQQPPTPNSPNCRPPTCERA